LRTIAERILGLIPARVSYADVRVVQRVHEGLHVDGSRVDQLLTEESVGVGVRVLVRGHWGFAATSRLGVTDLDAVVRRAVQQAAAADGLGPPVRLAPAQAVHATYTTPLLLDPFDVPLNEKLDLLLESAAAMRRAGGSGVSAQASMDFFQDRKLFLSTEGALIEQTITESGAGLMATASNGADLQRRSSMWSDCGFGRRRHESERRPLRCSRQRRARRQPRR
jgi:TldD protein